MNENSNKAEGPESEKKKPDHQLASELSENVKGSIRHRLKSARKWIIGVVIIGALGAYLKDYLVDIATESIMSPKEFVCIVRDYFQTLSEEPPPDGVLYTLLLSDLVGDEGREVTRTIESILDKQDKIHILTTCRKLRLEEYGLRSRRQTRLHDRGQEWLKKRGADILIFGVVEKQTQGFRLSFLPRRYEIPIKDVLLEEKRYNLGVKFPPVNQEFSSQLTSAAALSLLHQLGMGDRDWIQWLKLEAEKLSQLIEHSASEMKVAILAWRHHLFGDLAQEIALHENDIDWIDKAIDSDRKVIELLESSEDENIAFSLKATTLNNLGNALRIKFKFTYENRLLEDSRDVLVKSIDAYRQGGRNFEASRAAHNLGLTLAEIGDLNGAVNSLKTALKSRTKKDWPAYWATTMSQLAIVKKKLGVKTGNIEIIQEAVAGHREVMTVLTKEKYPKNWGVEQIRIGDALLELGKFKPPKSESQRMTLTDAKEAYLAALNELPREEMPDKWAKSQTGLSATFANLGILANEPGQKKELFLQAVQAIVKALEELTYLKDPKFWKGTHDNLGVLLTVLCNWPGGIPSTDGLVGAENNIRVSMHELEISKTEENRRKKQRHAEMQMFLGELLLAWGRCDDSPEGAEAIKRAKTAYEAAFEEFQILRMKRGASEAKSYVVDAMEALARHPGGEAGK